MFRGIFRILISYLLIIYSLFLLVSLIKFSPNDLSFYTTALNSVYSNILGYFGVLLISPIVFFYGNAAWIWATVPLIFGLKVLLGITPKDLLIQFGIMHYLAVMVSILISLITMNFSFISGGIFGSLVGHWLTSILPNYFWIPIISMLIILGLSGISKILHNFGNKLLLTMNSVPQKVIPANVPLEYVYDEAEESSKDIIIGEYYDNSIDNPSMPIGEKMNSYLHNDEEMHYGSVLPQTNDIDDFHKTIEQVEHDHYNKVPSFLQEIEEEIDSPPQFLSKKTHKVINQEKDILRDTDIDLLSPYLGGSNTFYEKLDENKITQSKISHIETTTLKEDLQQATEGLDELDQSSQLMAPNSQWVIENGIPVTDFIRKPNRIKRLSFENGIIQVDKAESIEQETQVEDLSQEIVSNLEQEKNIETIPPILESENTESNSTDIEVSIIQHISKFPPVSTIEHTSSIILDELDNDILSFTQQDVEDQMFNNVSQTLLNITDTEKILIEGVERTTIKQQQALSSLKEKIYAKQKELADQYYTKLNHKEENINPNIENIPPMDNLVKEIDISSNPTFKFQDFEQEILELKKDSNSLDTVSQALTDDMFFKNTTEIPFETVSEKFNETDESRLSEYSSEELQKEMMIFENTIMKPSENHDITLLSEELENKISDDFDNQWAVYNEDIINASIESILPLDIEEQNNVQNTSDSAENDILSIVSNINEVTDEEIDAKIQKYVGNEYTQPELSALMRLDLKTEIVPDLAIPSSLETYNIPEIINANPLIDTSNINFESDSSLGISKALIDYTDQHDSIETIENRRIDQAEEEFVVESSIIDQTEDEPVVENSIIDQTEDEPVVENIIIDQTEDYNKDLILDNEDDLQDAVQNTAERIIPSIENSSTSIKELDTPESLLMPSVATIGHLVQPLQYPASTTETPIKPPVSSQKDPIFPKIEDLDPNTETISKELEDEEIENTMKMIEDTYESFNINMQVVDYNRGPTITRFELDPPSGLKLRTILNLQDDLALQAGTSNLRIISPVEGRSLIGIEVPNKVRRNFLLREQIESTLFENSQAALPLILGIDVGGKEIVGDLATTPHLLIAGTTGSGKSVYVNALIMGLLFKLSAEDLKFIMIDPKMVELELYNGIPHLLAPIITKPEEAMAALEWAVQEMDRRYKILSELSVRNIKEYQVLITNTPTKEQGYEKLPYIVIIVDEFANLMLRAPKDTEKHISRLASMSRAVGIHLVLATQRPSVDVVTGVIKANFPSRIAFRVSSKIDSRTIIDRNGAEALLGRGDMLFMSPNYMEPIRIQSPYASSEDVARAVMTVKKNGPPEYAIDFSEVLAQQESVTNNSESSRTDAFNDPLFEEVLRYAVDNGEISASGIQRRFRVGYNRASRLIESMKDMKIISPPPSAGKGWVINITRDEINSYLN